MTAADRKQIIWYIFLIFIAPIIMGATLLFIGQLASYLFREKNMRIYRIPIVMREVNLLCSQYVNGELSLENNAHFALLVDGSNGRLYYRLTDTWNATAEIGAYVSSKDLYRDSLENEVIFYGVELQSNFIYISTLRGNNYYIKRNVFPIAMTHKKLIDFLSKGDWSEYLETDNFGSY